MASGRRRRSGGRRVSYSYKEAFKNLELSGSESEAVQELEDEPGAADEEDEPDEFLPPAEDEVDAEELMDDVEEGDESEIDGDEDEDLPPPPKKNKRTPRRGSAIDVSSDMDIEHPFSSAPVTPSRPLKGSERSTGTPGTKGGGASTVRQRAAKEWREGGQGNRLRNLFGPTKENLRPVVDVKQKWLSQATLPRRQLRHLAPSPYVAEVTREKEARTLRKWYADVGRDAFAHGQETRPMNEEESQAYMVNHGPQCLNLLMGGIKSQRVYTLRKGEFLSTSAPFGASNTRKGWTFNLGSRIQDAQWAPSEQCSTQYLAVTVDQKPLTSKKHDDSGNPKAPAFTATKPFPASIQIWAFESKSDGSMDPSKEPRLAHVICTDWGAPKAIRWWPKGATGSVDQAGNDVVRLGLLAGLWSDGKVRVLDVSFQNLEADSSWPQYLHYSTAALVFAFPDTIPSCLCWASPTTLAIGTASGVLAIWTLSRQGMFSPREAGGTERSSPRPWFHKQVSDTYIITLSSGYPSHPHLISISSADGFTRLVDLRTPFADAISSARGRMTVHTQAWHEHTQSFVMVDEYYLLKHSSIRRYHQALYAFRMESTITACATSPVHPAVLMGSSAGSVVTTNGLCKILKSKQVPWSQVWFRHEWRSPMNDGGADEAEDRAPGEDVPTEAEGETVLVPKTQSSPVSPAILSQSLTRITEGYKPVQMGMVYPEDNMRYKEGAKFITIYEENSAVTRVAWNPNMKFGTWAVAGMQSGMLRVEDLGV